MSEPNLLDVDEARKALGKFAQLGSHSQVATIWSVLVMLHDRPGEVREMAIQLYDTFVCKDTDPNMEDLLTLAATAIDLAEYSLRKTIEPESLDLAGWGFVLYERIRRLRAREWRDAE